MAGGTRSHAQLASRAHASARPPAGRRSFPGGDRLPAAGCLTLEGVPPSRPPCWYATVYVVSLTGGTWLRAQSASRAHASARPPAGRRSFPGGDRLPAAGCLTLEGVPPYRPPCWCHRVRRVIDHAVASPLSPVPAAARRSAHAVPGPPGSARPYTPRSLRTPARSRRSYWPRWLQ